MLSPLRLLSNSGGIALKPCTSSIYLNAQEWTGGSQAAPYHKYCQGHIIETQCLLQLRGCTTIHSLALGTSYNLRHNFKYSCRNALALEIDRHSANDYKWQTWWPATTVVHAKKHDLQAAILTRILVIGATHVVVLNFALWTFMIKQHKSKDGTNVLACTSFTLHKKIFSAEKKKNATSPRQ